MLSDTMLKALNKQITEEVASAYIYQAMSADCKSKNFEGAAAWFAMQTQEELAHAQKIYDFIYERGGKVTLEAIPAPPATWDSLTACFEHAYKHETYITSCIHKLAKQARDEDDFASENMLQWFVNEQVEEEATADEIVQKLKMIGDSKPHLYMFDKELGSRGVQA